MNNAHKPSHHPAPDTGKVIPMSRETVAQGKRQSAKSIRNEDARRRAMPIDQWMQHVGFTAEQVEQMKAESAARLAAAGIK